MKYLFKYCHLIFCISILNIVSLHAFAQGWEDQQGEIEDTEVVIEKNIKIELPFAARNFQKIPPQPISIKPGPLTYNFANIHPNLVSITPRLRVVTVKDEEIRKLYGGYVKGGFGNYGTPLLDAYLFTKRNDKYSLGIYGSHLSSSRGPIDGKNSASSDSNLGISGKVLGTNSSLTATADYMRMGRYFYGYTDGLEVDRDTIRQVINRLKVALNLSGKVESSPWSYGLNAAFQTINDKYDAVENQFIAGGKLKYTLNDESSILVNLNYDFISRKDSLIDGLDRHVLEINPAYHFILNDIDIIAGANMALENDTLKGLNKFHFYPNIRAQYNFSKVSIYVGLTGGIQKRTLDSWLSENQFLNRNVPIFHASNSLEFLAGLRGEIVNNLGFQLGGSISAVKNISYLKNDSLDMARFDVVYDSVKTTVVDAFGELSYQKEKGKIWVRADYWSYSGGSIEEPWQKPDFGLTFGARINIYDKILLSGDFKILSGIKAYDYAASQVVDIDPFLGLNFSADYLLSRKASIFIQANNVLSSKNEVFYRYPSRKFQIIGGITFAF